MLYCVKLVFMLLASSKGDDEECEVRSEVAGGSYMGHVLLQQQVHMSQSQILERDQTDGNLTSSTNTSKIMMKDRNSVDGSPNFRVSSGMKCTEESTKKPGTTRGINNLQWRWPGPGRTATREECKARCLSNPQRFGSKPCRGFTFKTQGTYQGQCHFWEWVPGKEASGSSDCYELHFSDHDFTHSSRMKCKEESAKTFDSNRGVNNLEYRWPGGGDSDEQATPEECKARCLSNPPEFGSRICRGFTFKSAGPYRGKCHFWQWVPAKEAGSSSDCYELNGPLGHQTPQSCFGFGILAKANGNSFTPGVLANYRCHSPLDIVRTEAQCRHAAAVLQTNFRVTDDERTPPLCSTWGQASFVWNSNPSPNMIDGFDNRYGQHIPKYVSTGQWAPVCVSMTSACPDLVNPL
eukprot:gnl/MRDRNA2_/MRDRNA2_56000_c0_seq1.p1 gnl/MRDRNA2_/MRDRNA2_56000_c0~~gnl/MRDRNA2_/MRDRNA2_56000_c0_seq1.p1  ORF type:complete len:407 (-),score=40.50 gnl/MRDRNA2_/MRDRNA2_56000_c0_seq1:227-1447(-)